MASVPIYQPPFLLVHENGRSDLYDSLADLAQANVLNIRYLPKGMTTEPFILVETFSLPSATTTHPNGQPPRALIRDFYGRSVARAAVLKVIEEVQGKRGWLRRLARRANLNALYRLGKPIPHTGHSRYRGNMLRYPRHIGLYKAGQTTKEQTKEAGWGKNLKEHHPPNSWDDLVIATQEDRNWKLFRKTKWKRPTISFRLLNAKEF